MIVARSPVASPTRGWTSASGGAMMPPSSRSSTRAQAWRESSAIGSTSSDDGTATGSIRHPLGRRRVHPRARHPFASRLASLKKFALKRYLGGAEKGLSTDDLLAAVREKVKENEDLPNTTNPDDWAKIAGKKGERVV